MSGKSIKSTFSVAIVTVFPSFVTDEAGGISKRNVLQIYECCDWCAGVVWKNEYPVRITEKLIWLLLQFLEIPSGLGELRHPQDGVSDALQQWPGLKSVGQRFRLLYNFCGLFRWYVPVWIAAFSLLVIYVYIIVILRRKVSHGEFCFTVVVCVHMNLSICREDFV